MAEVLITLGIIGVVASMTIPSLIQNKQNKELEAGLRKGYALIEQFIQTATYEEGQVINHINYPWRNTSKLFKSYFGAGDVKYFLDKKDEYDDNGEQIGWEFGDYKTYNKKQKIAGHLMDDSQIVLKNGMTIYVEDGSDFYISIDVNGIKKGPNLWGHDLFTFQVMDTGKILPMGADGTKYSRDIYCSKTDTTKYNGIACTYDAITDKNYFKNRI